MESKYFVTGLHFVAHVQDYAKRKSIIRLNTQALMSPKLK